jgi:hypothetical protein
MVMSYVPPQGQLLRTKDRSNDGERQSLGFKEGLTLSAVRRACATVGRDARSTASSGITAWRWQPNEPRSNKATCLS